MQRIRIPRRVLELKFKRSTAASSIRAHEVGSCQEIKTERLKIKKRPKTFCPLIHIKQTYEKGNEEERK
jgi:hypothetical protein